MADQNKQAKAETLIATHHSLVIPLTEAHQNQIRECLNRSGRVTFSMREVEISEFPQTLMQDALVIVD